MADALVLEFRNARLQGFSQVCKFADIGMNTGKFA
jgi:hypothetical protein